MSTNDNLNVKFAVKNMMNDLHALRSELKNPEKQLDDAAVVVNNFVLQTLAAVNDNEDLAAVNEILTNSLVQIRNFTNARSGEIKRSNLIIEAKLLAYKECLAAVDEIEKARIEKEKPNLAEPSEATIERIKEDIDDEGRYTKERQVGDRPEKLSDIRAAEQQVATSNTSSE